ncbi:hypothetical protein CAP35_15350 [Chitinophagaceae bacterium IBVUCB1]|nr:hypothetical protein CAP35_15350 [Chitinophagaceae bacterium IBVUCB1]
MISTPSFSKPNLRVVYKYIKANTKWLPYFVILAGIVLRINVFTDNRSLILDEANLALNIHSKGYLSLLSALDYEQFAPPGYLWLLKGSTTFFGYSEYGFRIVALLAGIVSLLLLYHSNRVFAANTVAWYSLALFAAGDIFLYYGTAVKQYSTDILITIALIIAGLCADVINPSSPKRFYLGWMLAGFSIYFSMPAVFILAGIGLSFIYTIWCSKNYSRLWPLLGICGVWLGMFGAYYFLMLNAQIHSPYLQDFHQRFFSILVPLSKDDWLHNGNLWGDLLLQLGGNTTLAIVFHLTLLATGTIYLLYKHTSKGIVLLLPILLLHIASGLQMYTLLPRVSLFIMPVALIIMTAGLSTLWQLKYKTIRIALLAIMLVSVYNAAYVRYFSQPLLHEEFKDGMRLVQKNGINGKHFHVNGLIENVFMYYTNIHPNKDEWASLKDAHIAPIWGNYDSLAQTFTRDAVIYAWYPDDLLKRDNDAYTKYCKVDTNYIHGIKLYICTKK